MESDTDPDHTMMIEQNVPLNIPIDPSRARFPCSIVWTPLPVVSWLLPFVGHTGICREDGVILDFAGPNFVCVDNFTFGKVARYIQINKDKVFCYYYSLSMAFISSNFHKLYFKSTLCLTLLFLCYSVPCITMKKNLD